MAPSSPAESADCETVRDARNRPTLATAHTHNSMESMESSMAPRSDYRRRDITEREERPAGPAGDYRGICSRHA